MLYFIIYLIGYICAFCLCIKYKESDAKYSYKMYHRNLTNGIWLTNSLLQSLLSWLIVICMLTFNICTYINKLINKLQLIKKFKKWWHKPIIKLEKYGE